MTDEAMSPLRRRMIEDMTIRKLAPKTQEGYIRTIKSFAAFLGRSPDRASLEEVRRFQLHLAENGAQAPILNHTVSALRFFFRVTLKRHDIIEHTTFIREPRKLPVVLSPEEVARLLNAAPGLKYKAALSVAYGARLRSGFAQGQRHRQQAHAHPCGARQGPQRPQRDAVAASARTAARLVEGSTASGMAVSRTEPGQPSHYDEPANPLAHLAGSPLAAVALAQLSNHPSRSSNLHQSTQKASCA